MNHHDTGPPDRGGGPGSRPGTADHPQHRRSIAKDQQHSQGNAEGFERGFHDALHCVSLRTDDPAVWVMLSRLADEFFLAAGDD
jgi:hypothetical protein